MQPAQSGDATKSPHARAPVPSSSEGAAWVERCIGRVLWSTVTVVCAMKPSRIPVLRPTGHESREVANAGSRAVPLGEVAGSGAADPSNRDTDAGSAVLLSSREELLAHRLCGRRGECAHGSRQAVHELFGIPLLRSGPVNE